MSRPSMGSSGSRGPWPSRWPKPGSLRTPLVEGQIAAQAQVHGISPHEVVERIMLAPAAVKRLLEPDEVAALVLYLCGDAAAGITGGAFPIDGGWTAR